MFINKQLDDDLKKYIDGIDWTDTVPDADKNKYQTDTEFVINYKANLYNKYSVEIEDLINKVTEPFKKKGFIVTLSTKSMGDWLWSKSDTNKFCYLSYNIKYTNDIKTNPFDMEIRFVAEKNFNKIDLNWFIYSPRRLKYKNSLRYACDTYCNSKLFTTRGFRRYGYQTYKYTGDLIDWYKIEGYADKIIEHLKKTIVDLKTNHDIIQKQVKIKEKIRKIQFDDVYCAVSEINSNIKDINVKLLIQEYYDFDRVDTPIQFHLQLSNNPEQNREDLYVDDHKEILLEDCPQYGMTQQEYEEKKKLAEANKIKLFSYLFGGAQYSRSKYRITIKYNGKREKPWSLELYNWNMTSESFKILYGEKIEDFVDIDELKNYLLKIIKIDNELYNKTTQWLEDAHRNS